MIINYVEILEKNATRSLRDLVKYSEYTNQNTIIKRTPLGVIIKVVKNENS